MQASLQSIHKVVDEYKKVPPAEYYRAGIEFDKQDLEQVTDQEAFQEHIKACLADAFQEGAEVSLQEVSDSADNTRVRVLFKVGV